MEQAPHAMARITVCKWQDSSRQRTIYKVEIEDERRNNLLSIAVRTFSLVFHFFECGGKDSNQSVKSSFSDTALICYAHVQQFKDPPQSYLRCHSQDGDSFGPFGLEYTFTLRETELNKNAVDNVPEWMLPLDALKVSQSKLSVL